MNFTPDNYGLNSRNNKESTESIPQEQESKFNEETQIKVVIEFPELRSAWTQSKKP